MQKLVPKHTIKRIGEPTESKELCDTKNSLALAEETDDVMFQELMQLLLEDRDIWDSEEGKKLKRDFDRMQRGI